MEEKKSYYAIIPANVRYDENICANAKLLYGEITALCNEKGYCWASNSYFAELYKVSKISISKWIKQLIDNKYIETEIVYREGTKEILYRYIKIIIYPIKEKFNTPIKEKFKENNTINNNTINNTVNKSKKETKQTFDSLIDNYTENKDLRKELKNHLVVRKQKKGALTNRAIELSFKDLDNLTKNKPINIQDEEKIKIVQQSIIRGWIGFFELKEKQGNNMHLSFTDVAREMEGKGW